MILLSSPQAAVLGLQVDSATTHFMWLLGIQTEVLMLATARAVPTEPAPCVLGFDNGQLPATAGQGHTEWIHNCKYPLGYIYLAFLPSNLWHSQISLSHTLLVLESLRLELHRKQPVERGFFHLSACTRGSWVSLWLDSSCLFISE